MTPAARLQASLELLDAIETVARPADALISHYFMNRRYIGSKDRKAVAEMTYAILRHHARLDWWLATTKTEAAARPRLLAYLTLVSRMAGKEINTLFSGGQFAPAPLSADEKKLLKKLESHTIDHPDMPETTLVECPDWAAAGLKKRFGRSFKKELTALLDPAPLDLRINPLKITREDALASLQADGLPAEATPLSPWGLRLKERVNLGTVSLLKNGSLEIQDEGSQLIALLVDAKPGERVVDFCAGAGGKTLALSASMENKGRIIACDVMANRLGRSTERFRRAGLHNIETLALSSETDPWVKRHKESFDRVLTDVPCSGSGTWRRNPDTRWKNLGPSLETLLEIQGKILNSAARLVKPGGRLVYSTCSLLPQENQDQIETFLAANKDFAILPVAEALPHLADLKNAAPYLALTPAQHGTDGFFGAILVRRPRND